MFIEPIKINDGLGKIIKPSNDKKNDVSFKSIFSNALDSYVESENQVDKDIYDLSTGESTDDLHSLMINAQKAEISLDLVLQLRNKTLDAYNEIMRINL